MSDDNNASTDEDGNPITSVLRFGVKNGCELMMGFVTYEKGPLACRDNAGKNFVVASSGGRWVHVDPAVDTLFREILRLSVTVSGYRIQASQLSKDGESLQREILQGKKEQEALLQLLHATRTERFGFRRDRDAALRELEVVKLDRTTLHARIIILQGELMKVVAERDHANRTMATFGKTVDALVEAAWPLRSAGGTLARPAA